jgi:hypothetical protein
MEQIKTKAHVIYRDEHGIIHLDVVENAHVDKDSIIALHDIYRQLGYNEKKLVKVDARSHHTMCNEAMEYLKSDMLDKDRIATAIISEKLGIRIMIDYFTSVVKGSHVKMFSTEPEAMAWLKTFLN